MLRRVRHPDGLVGYVSPRLLALGVRHLFTTRHGGAAGESSADYGGALLRRAAEAADCADATLVALRQVHGAEVISARDALARTRVPEDAGGTSTALELPRADGVYSDDASHVLAVRTADCVPVLLASRDGRLVAAVHAGWRGLVAGILPHAVETLRAAGADGLLAAVGPCLSPERFEVGDEVAEDFARAGLDEFVRRVAGARPHVDLRLAAARQLVRHGVVALDVSDRCTWTHADDFHSYRRDVTHGGMERTGQLGALVAVRRG
ncbi:MAG: peptidoglycan editing factor PgeF [Planctomycetes bacterium]|nr:peptidoglycan editing factor PgeF [Planctomycetota bacterium]